MASATNPSYLDVQAAIGITKHNGGYPATNRLLDLCHAEDAREVLYVGSGIGVGPAYIAKRFGCRVVAADISEQMLEWTARRARQEGVDGQVEPVLADILDMPFDDGRFDLVIVESVVAFIEDKQRSIAECVRVTRPGGWVGMNEAVWKDERPQPDLASVANVLGTWLPTQAEWRVRWEASGLSEQAFEVYDIALAEEGRSRVEWIGWRWLLPAWGRAIRLAISDGRVRGALREQLSYPPSLARLLGYALSAGQHSSAKDGDLPSNHIA